MTSQCTQESPATIDGATLQVLPTPRRIDLANLEQVRQEMARVYRDMRHGSIESQDGTRLVYVLRNWPSCTKPRKWPSGWNPLN